MERQKLRTHLFINIVSFVVVMVVMVAGLFVFFTTKTVEDMVFDKTDDTLRIIELEMEHYLGHPISEMEYIVELINEQIVGSTNFEDIDVKSKEEFYDMADIVFKQFNDIVRLDIINENGIVISSLPYSEGIIGFDLSMNNIYKKIKYSAKDYVLGEMIVDPFLQEPTMYVSMKLDKGYVVGYINLESFKEILRSVIIDDGYICVIDEYGTYMSHTKEELVDQRVVDSFAQKIKEGEIDNRSRVFYQGEEQILQFVEIKDTNWFILYYQNIDTLYKPITRAIIFIVIVFITILPVLIFILFRIIKRVDASLDELVIATKNVAIGQYDFGGSDFYYDEFNRLFESVRYMSNEVSEREEEVISLNLELESNYYTMVVLLAKAIEAKDNYTGNHCERVRDYSMLIGEGLELKEVDLRELKFGSTLHDIGKLGIPELVLNKPGKFTDEEYEIIKSHSQLGFDIMHEMPSMVKAKQIILHHHERVDGHGYPYGLKGHEIPLLARIVSVADAFDAMTSERPYKNHHMTKKEGFIELRRNAGSQFDASLVEIFIDKVKKSTSEI